MTLGIVGLGRIGKRMAHISRNTFKRVIACDPYLIDGDFPAYVERADLGSLFEQSEVVSLHTPLNDETRGMIDERVLRRMQRGSFLVNTSRGAVVMIDHLLDALDSGILAGAGLDVLPVEPPPSGSRLLGHPKVILTPHVAYFSAQSEIELRRKAAVSIRAVRKNFGSTQVIRGVDIDIADGEFCVLVGPSGCGKSTLLRMIAGLEEITDGEVSIGGRVVNRIAPKQRDIAMVFQNYALYPHMTVRDNMSFALMLAKQSKSEILSLIH